MGFENAWISAITPNSLENSTKSDSIIKNVQWHLGNHGGCTAAAQRDTFSSSLTASWISSVSSKIIVRTAAGYAREISLVAAKTSARREASG